LTTEKKCKLDSRFEKKKSVHFDLDEDESDRIVDIGKAHDIDPDDKKIILTRCQPFKTFFLLTDGGMK